MSNKGFKGFTLAEVFLLHSASYRKAAFTLAEVLITLGIIGVVAVMTMPSLIAKHKEKQTVVAVKTAYSIFSQAFLRVANEYGGLDNLYDSNKTNGENAVALIDELAKYMKEIKHCGAEGGCMPDKYKSLTGLDYGYWEDNPALATGILTNGMSFWVLNIGSNVQVGVDINGRKKPNQFGYDWFWFTIDNNGRVFPSLHYSDSYFLCDIENTIRRENGYYCSKWIIQHENMDYLRHSIYVPQPQAPAQEETSE